MFAVTQQPTPNLYERPPTTTLTFHQKRYDKSGELRNEVGEVVYRIKNPSDDRKLGFMKFYPLEITRVKDNEMVTKVKWNKKPKETTVEGLVGHDEIVEIQGRLMFKDLTPPVVANWTPRPTKKEFATLEVHKDALAVPGLLEHAIVTSMFLEWTVYYDVESKEAKKIGEEIGAELAAVLSK